MCTYRTATGPYWARLSLGGNQNDATPFVVKSPENPVLDLLRKTMKVICEYFTQNFMNAFKRLQRTVILSKVLWISLIFGRFTN